MKKVSRPSQPELPLRGLRSPVELIPFAQPDQTGEIFNKMKIRTSNCRQGYINLFGLCPLVHHNSTDISLLLTVHVQSPPEIDTVMLFYAMLYTFVTSSVGLRAASNHWCKQENRLSETNLFTQIISFLVH